MKDKMKMKERRVKGTPEWIVEEVLDGEVRADWTWSRGRGEQSSCLKMKA